MPVVIAVSVHPRAGHTRRVATDHLHGIARFIRVNQLSTGVPTAPGRYAAALFRRPSTSLRPSVDDRGWDRTAADTAWTRGGLARHCRTPPRSSLHHPVLYQQSVRAHIELSTIDINRAITLTVEKVLRLQYVPTFRIQQVVHCSTV